MDNDNIIYINDKRSAMYSRRIIHGNNNVIYGHDNTVYGNNNIVKGDRNTVVGENNTIDEIHTRSGKALTSQREMLDEFAVKKGDRTFLEQTLGSVFPAGYYESVMRIINAPNMIWQLRAQELEVLAKMAYRENPGLIIPFGDEKEVSEWFRLRCEEYVAHLEKATDSEEQDPHRDFLENVLGAVVPKKYFRSLEIILAGKTDWRNRATDIEQMLKSLLTVDPSLIQFTSIEEIRQWFAERCREYENRTTDNDDTEFLNDAFQHILNGKHAVKIASIASRPGTWQVRAQNIIHYLITYCGCSENTITKLFRARCAYFGRIFEKDDDCTFLDTMFRHYFSFLPINRKIEFERLKNASKPWQERARDIIEFLVSTCGQNRNLIMLPFRKMCTEYGRNPEEVDSAPSIAEQCEAQHRQFLKYVLGAVLPNNIYKDRIESIIAQQIPWKERAEQIVWRVYEAFENGTCHQAFQREDQIRAWFKNRCDSYENTFAEWKQKFIDIEMDDDVEFLKSSFVRLFPTGRTTECMLIITADKSWQERARDIITFCVPNQNRDAYIEQFREKCILAGRNFDDDIDEDAIFLDSSFEYLIPERLSAQFEALCDAKKPWQDRARDIILLCAAELGTSIFDCVAHFRETCTIMGRQFRYDNDTEFLRKFFVEPLVEPKIDEFALLLHANKSWQERARDIIDLYVSMGADRKTLTEHFSERCNATGRQFHVIGDDTEFLRMLFFNMIPAQFTNEYMSLVDADKPWQQRARDLIDWACVKLGGNRVEYIAHVQERCNATGRQFDTPASENVRLMENAFGPYIRSTNRPQFNGIINAQQPWEQIVRNTIEFCVNVLHFNRMRAVEIFNEACQRFERPDDRLQYEPRMFGRALGFAATSSVVSIGHVYPGDVTMRVDNNLPVPASPPPPTPRLPSLDDCAHDIALPEDAMEETPSCLVCLDNQPICIVIPCFHKCICCACANALLKYECPKCRIAFSQIARVFE